MQGTLEGVSNPVVAGLCIQDWRAQECMSRAELAGKLGTKEAVVVAWEEGRKKIRNPHKARLMRLMAGKPIGPEKVTITRQASSLLVERETVERLKFSVSIGALAQFLGLPDGAELTVIESDGKTRVAFPVTVTAEVFKTEVVKGDDNA